MELGNHKTREPQALIRDGRIEEAMDAAWRGVGADGGIGQRIELVHVCLLGGYFSAARRMALELAGGALRGGPEAAHPPDALAAEAATLARIARICCCDRDVALDPRDLSAASGVLASLVKGGIAEGEGFRRLAAAAAIAFPEDGTVRRVVRSAFRDLVAGGQFYAAQALLPALPADIAATHRVRLGLALARQAAAAFDPELPSDQAGLVAEFPGHPEIELFAERLPNACLMGRGTELRPEDEVAVELVLRRAEIIERLGSPAVERLFAAAADAFPESAQILRHRLSRHRSGKRMPEVLRIARRLTRHPESRITDLFNRFDALNKLDRIDVSARYVRSLLRARERGSASGEFLAERFWAAQRPALALETLAAGEGWARDRNSAEIALRSLVTLRRFREAERLLGEAEAAGFVLPVSLKRAAQTAVEFLDRHGIETPDGTDAALPVVRHFLDRLRRLPPPPYEPVPKRVMLSAFSLGIGGAERQVAALAAALSVDPEVESVQLLVRRESRATYSVDALGERVVMNQILDLLPPPGHVLREDPLLAEIGDVCGTFGLHSLYAAICALHSVRPDIVHVRGGLHAEMVLAALLAGTPRVLVHFGSMTRGHQSLGTDLSDQREDLLESTMRAAAVFPQVGFATNSAAASADWARAMEVAPARVAVLYNGIDEKNLNAGGPAFVPRVEGGPVVGSVFRFAPVKDPLLWIEVARRVVEEVPEVRFLLVGDGPMRDAINRKLEAFGLVDRFEMPGLVTEGVPAYLRRMDVFLMTSRTESLPNAVIEAQLAGVPVVAPEVGGVSEALGSAATGFVTPRDPQSLAAAVVAALRDEAWRGRVRAEAPALIRDRFSLSRQLEATRRAYGWNS